MSESASDKLNHFLKVFQDAPSAAPLYFKKVNSESANANPIHFDRHFNPDLATDSNYFKSLNAFLSCVEKNAEKDLSEAQQEKVCATEYKNLRLRAFDNQLFYHHVNKKFFQNELAIFKHESPY